MAKRKSSSRKRRKVSVIPAETTLKYSLPGDGSDVYINLMKDLSAINRRGYHGGQVLQITGFTIKQNYGPGNTVQGFQSTIKALPMSWVAAQAYMKARIAWNDQQRRVRDESGQDSIRPAYEDFKVFMDNGHRVAGDHPTLDGAGNPVVQGEWDYSSLVYAEHPSETIRDVSLHMIGADVANTSIGLVNAYEDSRATVSATQPNVPGDASTNIYALMTIGQDDGAAEKVIENMEIENDNPPYSLAHYPGGPVNYPTNVDKIYVQTNPSSPVQKCAGFPAMLGLLRVYSQGKTLTTVGEVPAGSDVTLPATLLVHLAPGPKKGVLSMNVGELV